MKLLGKILLGLIVTLALVVGAAFLYFNESEPKGTNSKEADVVAEKMMAAVDKAAWDTTGVIQWTFKGMHTFLWDKKRHLVKVTWDENEVLLNPNEISGKAFQNGRVLNEAEGDKLVKEAWKHFCNDGFWLNAVVKAFDPGTSRSLVDLPDGKKGLKVSYASGGVTPGDSYLWILDENYRPTSYKMWVNIIPVGGLEFTWDKWEKLSTGAMISTFHDGGILKLDISNLKAAADLKDFGLVEDPFKDL